MKKQTFSKLHHLLDAKITRLFIALVIIIDLASTIASSFLEFISWDNLSFITTIFAAFLFTVEYGCRIVSAPAAYPHLRPWHARLRYLFSFFGIIDFIAILPFTGIFIFTGHYKALFEISQVFLIFKTIRYSHSFNYIGKVFSSVKEDLITVFGSIGIFVVFAALLMYHLEREAQPDVFENVGQGIWWAIVTCTTIGYGDIYPITPWGKIMGGFIALFGIMIVAIPTGIVSSAFVNYKLKNTVKENSRKQKESQQSQKET